MSGELKDYTVVVAFPYGGGVAEVGQTLSMRQTDARPLVIAGRLVLKKAEPAKKGDK